MVHRRSILLRLSLRLNFRVHKLCRWFTVGLYLFRLALISKVAYGVRTGMAWNLLSSCLSPDRAILHSDPLIKPRICASTLSLLPVCLKEFWRNMEEFVRGKHCSGWKKKRIKPGLSRVPLNPAWSASFFIRNSIFLSQIPLVTELLLSPLFLDQLTSVLQMSFIELVSSSSALYLVLGFVTRWCV